MKHLTLAFTVLLLASCSSGNAPAPAPASALPAPAAVKTAPSRPANGNPEKSQPAEGSCTAAQREALLDLLRANDPDGWRVFETEQRRGARTDQGKFVSDSFLDGGCAANDPADETLETAVHETVHALRFPLGGYDLLGGGLVAELPEAKELVPPRILAAGGSDPFVTNYLEPGEASSAEDFTFLLDELNAYAHDLQTSSRLDGKVARDSDAHSTPRDGSLALMAFVKRYVEQAHAREARTFEVLSNEPYRGAIRALWAQSETQVAESCRHERMGSEIGTKYLVELRGPAPALTALLGRAPALPAQCL